MCKLFFKYHGGCAGNCIGIMFCGKFFNILKQHGLVYLPVRSGGNLLLLLALYTGTPEPCCFDCSTIADVSMKCKTYTRLDIEK